MSKILQDVQKNGASAGDENIQMFVAGVEEASEKQVLLMKRASIERGELFRWSAKGRGRETKLKN
jgi:hypothetical protein